MIGMLRQNCYLGLYSCHVVATELMADCVAGGHLATHRGTISRDVKCSISHGGHQWLEGHMDVLSYHYLGGKAIFYLQRTKIRSGRHELHSCIPCMNGEHA